MQGWRKRQEDAHMSETNQGASGEVDLFGVFDGHGGKEVSIFVARHFKDEFLRNENYKKGNIKEALAETYNRLDEMMLEKEGRDELLEECKKSRDESERLKENNKNAQIEALRQAIDPKEQPDAQISLYTGTTANVLIIKDNKLYFANAGDSRAVISKKGKAQAMSIDHKPSLPNELKRIEKAGGWVSDGRILGNLNLSRGLGDSEYKMDPKLKPEEQIMSNMPDIKVESLTKDVDFIVMACDGIWDCMTNQEVVDFFSEKFKNHPNQKISSMIEELFDQIIAPDIYTDTGVGCDNMSCIVIKFKK